MNPSNAPIPSLALDVYWPMMKSAALITAGELGIFAALSPGPLPVEELAGRLGTSIQGTDRLCAVLTQTGYLERTPENRLGNTAQCGINWYNRRRDAGIYWTHCKSCGQLLHYTDDKNAKPQNCAGRKP